MAELDFLYILVNIILKSAHGAPGGLQEREDGEPGPGAAGQEAPPQEDPPAGENSVSHTEDCMSRPSDAFRVPRDSLPTITVRIEKSSFFIIY